MIVCVLSALGFMRFFIQFIWLYGSVKLRQSLHCCDVCQLRKIQFEKPVWINCSFLNRSACVCFPSSGRKPSGRPPPALPGPGWRRAGWRRTGLRSSPPLELPLQSEKMTGGYQTHHCSHQWTVHFTSNKFKKLNFLYSFLVHPKM